jgi:hypothetical protein
MNSIDFLRPIPENGRKPRLHADGAARFKAANLASHEGCA